MKTDEQLKKAIMRRVYVVYWMRTLMQPKVRFATLGVIFVAIASSVSLPNIVSNASRASDLVGFSVSAFSNTTLYIQFGVLAAGLIVIASLVEAMRPRELQLS